MPATPNPKVTIPGSGVLLHVLNPNGEPVPVSGDADGNVGTTGGGGGGSAEPTILLGNTGPATITGSAVVKASAGQLRRLVVHYIGVSASTFLQIHKSNTTVGLSTATLLEPGIEIGTGSKSYALFEPSIALPCASGIVLAFSTAQSTYVAAGAEAANVTVYGD